MISHNTAYSRLNRSGRINNNGDGIANVQRLNNTHEDRSQCKPGTVLCIHHLSPHTSIFWKLNVAYFVAPAREGVSKRLKLHICCTSHGWEGREYQKIKICTFCCTSLGRGVWKLKIVHFIARETESVYKNYNWYTLLHVVRWGRGIGKSKIAHYFEWERNIKMCSFLHWNEYQRIKIFTFRCTSLLMGGDINFLTLHRRDVGRALGTLQHCVTIDFDPLM